MIEVTQADVEASCSFLENWEPGPELTQDKLAVAFARHRIAALEEAATELERQDGHGEWSEAATAIRALKGPTDEH